MNREIDKRLVVAMFEIMQQQQKQIELLIEKAEQAEEISFQTAKVNAQKQADKLINVISISDYLLRFLILPAVSVFICLCLFLMLWFYVPSKTEIQKLRQEKAFVTAEIQQLKRQKTAITNIDLRTENNKFYIKVSKNDCLRQAAHQRLTNNHQYCRLN